MVNTLDARPPPRRREQHQPILGTITTCHAFLWHNSKGGCMEVIAGAVNFQAMRSHRRLTAAGRLVAVLRRRPRWRRQFRACLTRWEGANAVSTPAGVLLRDVTTRDDFVHRSSSSARSPGTQAHIQHRTAGRNAVSCGSSAQPVCAVGVTCRTRDRTPGQNCVTGTLTSANVYQTPQGIAPRVLRGDRFHESPGQHCQRQSDQFTGGGPGDRSPLTNMGAPKWHPKTPNARSAPAWQGRSSKYPSFW